MLDADPRLADGPPLGAPVRILNPDLTAPEVGYVREPDGGMCTALLAPDRSAGLLLPGASAVAFGIALARATVANLELLDKETCESYLAAAIALRSELTDLLDNRTGVVRDPERLQ
jgi:hypothetical protein